MSQKLVARSADLKKLRDHGFDIEIMSAYLLVKDIPYVGSQRQIRRGILVSKLRLSADATLVPDDHVAFFIGEHPCHRDGSKLAEIANASNQQQLAEGLTIQHTFSSKPEGGYKDYYEKMVTYVRIISGPARALDAAVTAQTFPVIPTDEEDSVHKYLDSASSRAEITAIADRLMPYKIAIIGVGGTGSYVLDFMAKTSVAEIHLFDDDDFEQHNAFRSPGAASIEDLNAKQKKVDYYLRRYSAIRRKLFVHPVCLRSDNLHLLDGKTFAFVCIDDGPHKRAILGYLQEHNIQFVDVGMGILEIDGKLQGSLRTTASTHTQRANISDKSRIDFSPAAEEFNEYDRSIQVVELNAMNAALAVVKFKKIAGFYQDIENEHQSVYSINDNRVVNVDNSK
jgi:hypothetical protein